MNRRNWLLHCYPRAWRERYGDDLAAYLDDAYGDHLPMRAATSLVGGGLQERARAMHPGSSADDQVRWGTLAVLVAWAGFVVAGFGFAKVSEHFGGFIMGSDPTVPDAAYVTVQVAAVLTALTVLLGVVVAIPALMRFLSGGGWSRVKRPVVRACVVSVLAMAMTVVLVAWAQGLTTAERNGSDVAYSLAFLAWAALVVLAIASWTIAGVVTGRHLTLSSGVLRAERLLATLATVGMLVIVVAVAAWWLSMASAARTFFAGSLAGPTPQLVGSFVLMVAALTLAVAGVVTMSRRHLTPSS